MNKLEASVKLSCIVLKLDELVWEIMEEIDDLEDTEHELQSVLSTITDMTKKYVRDLHIDEVRRLSQEEDNRSAQIGGRGYTMNKLRGELELAKIADALDELIGVVTHTISYSNDDVHELLPLLMKITDMYEIYERDIVIDNIWDLDEDKILENEEYKEEWIVL